ncbi:50S ribosomal protein L7/L12 [Salpingoeca rosetta]|uniref:50S ribosomal protein L7/L12 n=1 Tax=Salpingoeca rosetta (strain ATCC 50818 / BSB-021) TaxID=946362 RepID=F2UE41_SALR5|nr:50S ribosomal protein L7/L12 [Salpingoeca rosetta]EGD74891.1 50S ribosomal protein L7/L12 [Salpingoeca rosetta]|eukprot:XP_004992536.1 50S ribosomal protein L7/L12 [Salpingoeca rosetta]
MMMNSGRAVMLLRRFAGVATPRLVTSPAALRPQMLARASLSMSRMHASADAATEEQSKEYSPKIENLVSEISSMTLLEVADLVDALKTRLNISDMPVAAVGVAAAPAAEAAAEPVEEKTEFEVKLVKFEDKAKIKVIKEVRNILPDLKLAEAKKLVEDLPQTLKQDVSKEDAEAIKKALEEIGASVEIA